MTENELLKLLADELSYPAYDGSVHILIGQLTDAAGVGERTARTLLERKVKNKELIVEMVRMPSGRVAKAYKTP
jgi:hypothetical protein